MRLPLTLVCAALVLAGCATNNEATPTTTTPTSGGGTGANATMTGTTELAKDTHDFTTGAAAGTPAGGATSKAFTIPDAVRTLNLTVRFQPIGVGPGGLAAGVSVKVGDLTCAVPDGPVTAVQECVKEGAATPGDAKIEYAGAGPVTASVTVMGS